MVKRKEQTFDPLHIERMYDMGNKDGFGMMYVEKRNGIDRVAAEKSMGGWKILEELYTAKMDNDMAIHVRNATFGDKNLDNCHPYPVLDIDLGHKLDVYMMHNGSIRDIQIDKSMSDSYNFATKFLRGYLEVHPNALQDVGFQYLLAGLIGPNKLVFLDSRKRFTIINGDLGSIHPTGVWVSTKSDIKPYDYRTKKSNSIDTVLNKNENGNWKFSGKGTWKVEVDNRLHFDVSEEPESKTEDEEATDTIEEVEEKVGTDSGILNFSGEVDEEGLDEIIKRLPTAERQEVFKLVNGYHVEAAYIMKKILDLPDGQVRLMIAGDPWAATNAIIEAVQSGKHITQLN
jgi:hypothetical protein